MSVNDKYFALRNEITNLDDKLRRFELDYSQHQKVIETIKGLEDGRKCFMLIGEVLVGKTIGEARPELTQKTERLKNLCTQYAQMVDNKQKEFAQFQKDHNIKYISVSELDKK